MPSPHARSSTRSPRTSPSSVNKVGCSTSNRKGICLDARYSSAIASYSAGMVPALLRWDDRAAWWGSRISPLAGPSGGVVDLDQLHHADVFVIQDVTVQHEAAREVLEARAHRHAPESRHVDGIPPDGLRQRLPVLVGHQEGIRVDVVGMIGILEVGDRPLFHRAQPDALVDAIRIELATVDHEAELVEVIPALRRVRRERELTRAREL